MSQILHLILYADTRNKCLKTKQMLMKSIQAKCKLSVKIHSFDRNDIMNKPWFHIIKDIPKITPTLSYYKSNRDPYWNNWKPFLVNDVLQLASDNDLILWMDCSRYFVSEFEEPLDTLIVLANEEKMIAGAFSFETLNKDFMYDQRVYTAMQADYQTIIKYAHICNSWFIFVKNDTNVRFIEDFVYYCSQKVDSFLLGILHIVL